MVEMDLFEFNMAQDSIVIDYVIDYCSRYFEVVFLLHITSRRVLLKLKVMFARFGIPEVCRPDGGSHK